MSKQTDLLNLTDAITVDSSNNVGIGTGSLDNKVNIQESALSGRSASNGNTSMTIEHATDTGIQFFSATQTQLRFGDAASTGAGSIIYNHSDDSIRLSTNGSERMRIDSSGRVTMPYQPFMFIGRSSNYTTANNAQLKFNITHNSRGLSWNTSTDSFTAPVTGVYTFSISTRLDTNSLKYMYHRILTNGSHFPSSNALILQKPNQVDSFQTINTSVQVLLTQNDSISVSINYDGGGSHSVDSQSWMSVALLG